MQGKNARLPGQHPRNSCSSVASVQQPGGTLRHSVAKAAVLALGGSLKRFDGSSSPSRVSMPVIIVHLVAMSTLLSNSERPTISLDKYHTDGSIVWRTWPC